jgi:hypothetical protein
MTEIVRGILAGHVKPKEAVDLVNEAIRFAVGANRVVFVDVLAPEMPGWLP